MSRRYRFDRLEFAGSLGDLGTLLPLANFLAGMLGGIPLCHGAGGLAAHYRFGARTTGSNMMIGAIFLALAILFGSQTLSLVYLIPMSILGVLLLFAGS